GVPSVCDPITEVLPPQQSFTIRKPSSLTRHRSVRLAPIAEDSLLLPPVGVWAVSQSQCGRSPSQVGYASSPWWAFVPPPSQCASGPSASGQCLLSLDHATRDLSGISPAFPRLSRADRQVAYVLLTRPPLGSLPSTRRPQNVSRAQLPCIRRAASV